MIALLTRYRLVIFAAVAMVLFASGWKVRDWQADAQALQAMKDRDEMVLAVIKEHEEEQAKLAEVSRGLETKLAELRAIKERTRIIRVKEYEKADYTNCPVPAPGLHILRESALAVNQARVTR